MTTSLPTGRRSNYTGFASWLSEHHDTFAVRRFRELQIKNILFLQAELIELERELQRRLDKDLSVDFRWTPAMTEKVASPQRTVTPSELYCEVMLKIRATLCEYNATIDQYKKLNDIPSARRSDIRAIEEYLSMPELGAYFLKDDPTDVWTGTANAEDFYAFDNGSGLTFAFGRALQLLYQVSLGRFSRGRAHSIDTSTTGSLAKALSTILASVLPILPIVVFYFVTRLLVRIGLIIAFTAAFAATLAIGLQMEPDKTLSITTAIAAIQVVYVGTTDSSTTSD